MKSDIIVDPSLVLFDAPKYLDMMAVLTAGTRVIIDHDDATSAAHISATLSL
jgi:hypothetical protein